MAKKINAIKIVNSLLDKKLPLVVTKTNIDDYSEEDIMKLLINRINLTCHKSDALLNKANNIISKFDN